MERFKYRKSLVRLTVDNIITTRRNSRVDLYLRIRKVESRFPPDCLIIARLGFSKERIGHGTHLIRFLTGIAQKYSFNHIGIECANDKSGSLPKVRFLHHRWRELRNNSSQSNISFFQWNKLINPFFL